MIVADTNLIAYFFISGEHTADARSVFLKDPDWVAPLLWKSEFRNVVATYLRQGYFNLKDALNIAGEAERLLHGNEYAVPSDSVLKLVDESKCSAYDCEFAALAQEFGIKLVTSDKVILSAFPDLAVHIRKFESR
jgi:predicted nucleic acid-binding protein